MRPVTPGGTVVHKGRTIPDLRWPRVPDFVAAIRCWRDDGVRVMLRLVWEGFDRLRGDVLDAVDLRKADEELERSVRQLLVPKIRKGMTGFEPFDIEHGPYEFATREPAPAQPPQYDIAFVLYSNPCAMWPLEAKAMRTDASVASYVRDVNDEFLTCRYAPFSSEAAMLGYLFSGSAEAAFRNIAERAPCVLSHHPDFPERDHKTSEHVRQVPRGKRYSRRFRCHHMILHISAVARSQ